jgi:hypothetical protein
MIGDHTELVDRHLEHRAGIDALHGLFSSVCQDVGRSPATWLSQAIRCAHMRIILAKLLR